MSEPPGPRNHPPQQGGYSQPPPGYPQQPPPQSGYQQQPQPQMGYQQQEPPGTYQPQPQTGYPQHPPYAPRQPYPPQQPSEETTRDAQAALAARMELGPEYSEHVAAGLAERVEQLAALRAGELRHQNEVANATSRVDQSGRTRQFVLGIISLGVGVPITAIAATNTDPSLLGVAVSWLGIVGVNVVHARSNRPPK